MLIKLAMRCIYTLDRTYTHSRYTAIWTTANDCACKNNNYNGTKDNDGKHFLSMIAIITVITWFPASDTYSSTKLRYGFNDNNGNSYGDDTVVSLLLITHDTSYFSRKWWHAMSMGIELFKSVKWVPMTDEGNCQTLVRWHCRKYWQGIGAMNESF